MTTTWTTAEIRADHLAVADRADAADLTLTLIKVTHHGGAVGFSGLPDGGKEASTFGVPGDYRVTVHVPDEPVDGYNLWRPKPGTFSYSDCTCVHRRQTDGSWRPIDNDCPACVYRATDSWSD